MRDEPNNNLARDTRRVTGVWIIRIEIKEEYVTEGMGVERVRKESKVKEEGKKNFRY
jgi:hypothetical protein